MNGRDGKQQRGSALVLAVFVLALLSSLGIGLMMLSQFEVRSSRSSLRVKTAFFLAEAGQEDGRATLAALDTTGDLSDELATAAGPNGVIDFDPDSLAPVFDVDGNVIGYSGFGDDVPLRSSTTLGDGWYAAFLTNDRVEGMATTTDGNDRVIITGLGAGPDGSLELVQAIVSRTFPMPPATVTMLGPAPAFSGGDSSSKLFTGNDGDAHCPGGQPAVSVPAVGVFGAAAETAAEAGVEKPSTYVQGAETGTATVDDVSSAPDLDAEWTDCQALVNYVRGVRDGADVVGDGSTPEAALGVPGSPKIVFIDGDYVISGSFSGAGLLVVTGQLTLHGSASWQGPLFAVGQGDFYRSGSGNGTISGGVVIADVEGPDGALFTADDCSGEDGLLGTSDDGFAAGSYISDGGGDAVTGYCSVYNEQSMAAVPLRIVSFRQR